MKYKNQIKNGNVIQLIDLWCKIMNKRSLIKYTAAITAGSILSDSLVFAKKKEKDPIDFKSMTEIAQPITPNERKQRLSKAQELMQDQDIEALVLEAGSALIYFTGVKWRRSERFTGAVIP